MITKFRQWIQLDEEPAANFPMTLYYMGAAKASQSVGAKAGPIVLIYHGRQVRECVAKDGFYGPGRKMLARFLQDKRFLPWMKKQTATKAKKILKYSQRISQADLKTWSNTKLLQTYNNWYDLALDILSVSTYGTVMEFEEPVLSGPLYSYLQHSVPRRLVNQLGTIFTVLTTPTGDNENRTAEIKLIELVFKFRQRLPKKKWIKPETFVKYITKHNPKLLKQLTHWHNRYSYLAYGYSGPEKQLTESVDDFLRHLNQPSKLLINNVKELKSFDRNIKKKQQQWIRKIGIDSKHRHKFYLLKELGGLKRWRKKLTVRCQYLVHDMLVEIADRLNLPLIAVQSISPWEMNQVFKKKITRKTLLSRSKEVVIWIEGTRWKTLSSAAGKAVIKEINKSLIVKEVVNELKGMCACTGSVVGHVKILRNASDLSKFDAGDIIASPATSPELVPAMRRAAAIITDAGGITSHAAIVSRELGVPCVIGTKIATKVFKDGDKVEVDANKGVIRKIIL